MIKRYYYPTQGIFFFLFNLGTPVEEKRWRQLNQQLSSVAPGPAASPGNPLEMQSPGLHTRPPASETQEWGRGVGIQPESVKPSR